MDNMVKTFVNEEFGSVRTIEENGRDVLWKRRGSRIGV